MDPSWRPFVTFMFVIIFFSAGFLSLIGPFLLRFLSLSSYRISCWMPIIYLPNEGSSNSFLASVSPACVLVMPLGYWIPFILLLAVVYGSNLNSTLAELAKVTAAYLVLTPTLALANPIILLRAVLPLSNSHLPTDPEPSITTTISSAPNCLLPMCPRSPRNLVISLFAVCFAGGTVSNSANEISFLCFTL